MNPFYMLAGTISLVFIFAFLDDGMSACMKRNSFDACHHALYR